MNQSDPLSIPERDDDVIRASFLGAAPTTTTICQGGTRSIHAEQVTIRQGGVVGVNTNSLTVTMGGIVGVQANNASLTASNALGILARGEVALDQSGAGILAAGGKVNMDQCGTGALIAREVHAEKSGVVFLLAGKVTGDVKTVFGTRGALTIGAVVGAITGLTLAGLAMVKNRKPHS